MLLLVKMKILERFVATQLARQLQQKRLQVVCSNQEAQKRLAQ